MWGKAITFHQHLHLWKVKIQGKIFLCFIYILISILILCVYTQTHRHTQQSFRDLLELKKKKGSLFKIQMALELKYILWGMSPVLYFKNHIHVCISKQYILTFYELYHVCSNLVLLLPVLRLIHSDEPSGVTVTIHLLICHFV